MQFTVTLSISALFLVLGWLTADHFPPWVSWHNELWVFAAALCLAVGGLRSFKKHNQQLVIVPGLAWTVLGLWFVVLIQCVLGDIGFYGDALVISFYLFLCLLALIAGRYAVAQYPRNHQRVTRLLAVDYFAIVLTFGAACSSAIALAQALGVSENVSWITPMPGLRRPGGNVGQPNQLSTLLLMGLASLVYLFETKRLQFASTIALYLLLICGVAVSESRAGILGFLVMLVWWWLRYRAAGLRARPGYVFFWGISMLVLFWYWPPIFSQINGGGFGVDEAARVNTSAGARLIVWPQLIAAVLEHPGFGWGLGEVSKAHNSVLHSYVNSEPFTYAHNIVLDLAIGIGLPLTFVLLVLTITWLWRRVSAAQTLLPWYCLALLIPFCVHSMLEFPFAYAYFLAPAMFVVGVLEGCLAPQFYIRLRWWHAVTVVFCMTVLMAWSVCEYIRIEEDYRVARFEALHIGYTDSPHVRSKVILLTQLDAMLECFRIVPEPVMTQQRIELMRKVAIRYPFPVQQNRYALSLALNGNPDEALRQLKVIRAMHGEKAFAGILGNWKELSDGQYPQLKQLQLP